MIQHSGLALDVSIPETLLATAGEVIERARLLRRALVVNGPSVWTGRALQAEND